MWSLISRSSYTQKSKYYEIGLPVVLCAVGQLIGSSRTANFRARLIVGCVFLTPFISIPANLKPVKRLIA